MIIKNTEKQVLQKYYAERIKSRATNLKEIIQQDNQDVLASTLLDIKEDASRMCQIQNEWHNDQQNELIKLEQELKDQGPTATAKDAMETGGKIYG